MVLDLMPTVAGLVFEKRLGESVKPTAVQSAILLALGLQRKSIEEVEVCHLHRREHILSVLRPNYNCPFRKL